MIFGFVAACVCLPELLKCLERRDHRRRYSRDGDVLGAVADRQPHDLGALRDRDDRQIVAAGVGNETDAAVVCRLRPARRVADGDRGDQRKVRSPDKRGVV